MPNLENIRVYCEVTSICCVHYFVDAYNLIHKLFWVFVFTFATLFGFKLVLDQWLSWETSPTTDSVAIEDMGQLIFPAVTVCPAGATPWISYQNILNELDSSQDSIEGSLPFTKKAMLLATLSPATISYSKGDVIYQDLSNMEPTGISSTEYFPDYPNMFEEFVFKVDTLYKKECSKSPPGEYCNFHKSVVAEFTKWEANQHYKDWVKKTGAKRYSIDLFVNAVNEGFLSKVSVADKTGSQLMAEYLGYIKAGKFSDIISTWTDKTARRRRKRQDAATDSPDATADPPAADAPAADAPATDAPATDAPATDAPDVATEGTTAAGDYDYYSDIGGDEDPYCKVKVFDTEPDNYYNDMFTTTKEYIQQAVDILISNKNSLEKDLCPDTVKLDPFLEVFDDLHTVGYSSINTAKYYDHSVYYLDLDDFSSSLQANISKDQTKCNKAPKKLLENITSVIANFTDAINRVDVMTYPDGIGLSRCSHEYYSEVPSCIPHSQAITEYYFEVELPDYCNCRCEKKNKLLIYKMFTILTKHLTDEKGIMYFGDTMAWFIKTQLMKGHILNSQPEFPKANKNSNKGTIMNLLPADWDFKKWESISKEVLAIDKDFLKTMFAIDQDMGLADFIQLMSLPKDFTNNPFDFPKLTSWPADVRNEVFAFFNYSTKARWSGKQKLVPPNFEKIKNGPYRDLCSKSNSDMTNYCKMISKGLDIRRVMDIMRFANHPANYKPKYYSNSKYAKDNEAKSRPKESFLPLCMFYKGSNDFWNIPDLSLIALDNGDTHDVFKQRNKLEPSHAYRFPKCTAFQQRPSDLSLCHTFNGLPLTDILKDSTWLSSFQNTFTLPEGNPAGLVNVSGAGQHRGLTFIVDTMQSLKIAKESREAMQTDTEKFWIKIHRQGDIARLLPENVATWKLIKGDANYISNVDIRIMGEFSEATEDFRSLGVDQRNCYFSDEGDLQLFKYYSYSNCITECQWKKALEICGCKPWNVPTLDSERVCDFVGKICFDTTMENMNKFKDPLSVSCPACLSDCQGPDYTMEVQDQYDKEEIISICDTTPEGCLNKQYSEHYTTSAVQQSSSCSCSSSSKKKAKKEVRAATRWFNLADYIIDASHEVHPKDPFLKNALHEGFENGLLTKKQGNYYVVSVYMKEQVTKVNKMTRKVTATWSDKVAWVGGCIGGFNGFSILSAVEIFYWLAMIIFGNQNKVEDEGKDEDKEESKCDCKEDVKRLESSLEELRMKLKGNAGAGGEAMGKSSMAFDAIFNDVVEEPVDDVIVEEA